MPLPAGCVHLTGVISEGDQQSILAALDISDVHTTEGVRVPLPAGPPPAAVAAARAAFKAAAKGDAALYGELVDAPLLAQCVCYTAGGSMAPHVDASVTRSKPLVVLSLGLDCVFRAGTAKLRLRSGDAVALDAANTLHGVDAVVAGTSSRDFRVSLMFYAAPPACERGDDTALDGFTSLFEESSDGEDESDYAVLLFYTYARWRDRDAFRGEQEATCRALQLSGRLRVAEDGLNGTLGGPRRALEAYIEETRRQAAAQGIATADIDWKWGAPDPARPLEVQRLRTLAVKAVREVVAFSDCGGVDKQAIDAPPARKVDAAEFHSVLENGAGVVLVDVRNVYERRVGRFAAPGVRDANLQLRQFSDLPRALDDGALESASTILMYCTGGVRCERASAYLRSRGVTGDLCQLSGGIHRYQERYGNGDFFRGRCYVFDPRMAVGAPGESSPAVVGACRRCGRAWDDYAARDARCDRCRMRVLVCDSCDGSGLACELCAEDPSY